MRGTWWVAPLLALSVSAANGAGLPLVEAVKTSNVPTVRALLQRHVDVNARESDGSTALHWAANSGDATLVKLLLGAGARATAATSFGVTPIALAAAAGNASVVEQLLKAGADANTSMRGGETVLMTAARGGRPDVLKVLLSHGANVNASEPRRGQTALMWAAADGNADAIKVLVEAGADIRARSNERDFRFEPPSESGVGAIQCMTCERVKSVPPIKFTPLFFAVRNGHIDATRVLLDAGAGVDETLPDGTTPLVLAAINAHWELGSFLLDRGANPNADGSGMTALHQVAASRWPMVGMFAHPVPTGGMDALAFAKKLIAKGINVNNQMSQDAMRSNGYRTALNRVGATAYLLAARGADHELMRLLLANGADPLLTTVLDMRPLAIAAGLALHATGEDTGTNEDTLEAFKVALAADPDVNHVDKRGQTALHGAARRGVPEIVQLLIDKGAKLDARVKRENFTGQVYGYGKGAEWTPLTIALGRQKNGDAIFLGEQQLLDAAAVLYKAMKAQGVPIDEDPRSIAELEAIIAKKASAPR